MNEATIKALIREQRQLFATGRTLRPFFRLKALGRLEQAIRRHEEDIKLALLKDLGKSATESYMCEIGMVLSEITYMKQHLLSFATPQTVLTPLAQFCSTSTIRPCPYGTVLIMSPWNYPFLLSLEPLVDALAAGNTVILKPSAYAPHSSSMLRTLLAECFPSSYVAVVTGGREENLCLLEQHFDYIFFTGSKKVGQLVMRKASDHLTPVTLELGGKSPCIVEKTANIHIAAKRIIFGKLLNAGQTCVAPDYIYCERSVKSALIRELKRQIRMQYGDHPLDNEDFVHIINQKHFDRLCGLLDPEKTVWGGGIDRSTLRIEPTILDHVTWGDPVMQEEIFGPILPILTFDSLDEVIRAVNSRPHPLALYLFTKDPQVKQRILRRCSFGGGCVNDTIVHLATSRMPFGGVGASGMGSYHGKKGFDTFTHYKSIVDKHCHPDLPMRYQPYRRIHDRLLHYFLR